MDTIISLLMAIGLLACLAYYMDPNLVRRVQQAWAHVKGRWAQLSDKAKQTCGIAAAALLLSVFAAAMSGRASSFGLFAWNHWLPLAIVAIAVLVILDINKKKTWDKVVWGLLALLFIVLPIWAKVEEPSRSICDPVGWQTRSCLVTAVGTEYFSTESSIPSGLNVCYDPTAAIGSERAVLNGRAFFRFYQRSPGQNAVIVRYRVVSGACPLEL